MRQLAFIVASFLLVVAACRAQPLSDQLPDSTLMYCGWSASVKMLTTQSAGMLADPRIADPWRIMLKKLVLEFPHDLPADSEKISELFPKLLTEAGSCEGCFSLLNLQQQDNDLVPQAVLILDLGPRRKAFEEDIQPIHRMLKERLGERVHMMKLEDSWIWVKTDHDRSRYAWGFVGNRFVLYVGDGAETFLPTLSKKVEHPLSQSPRFVDCMSKVAVDSPVLSTYVNLKAGLGLVQQALKKLNNDDLTQLAVNWPMVMTQLGLDQATALGEKTAIENGQFVTHSLLRMTGPPHGLLPGMIQPGVDDEMLKVIPEDATYAVAGRLDLAKMFDQLKAFCVAVAGDDGRKAFAELEASATAAGLPLPALLSPLGVQWVLYDAKSTGSLFFTGTTLVVDVRDSDKLGKMLSALESLLAVMLGGDKPAMATSYEVDGHTIHYIQPEDFEFGRPSWAIVDKKLIVALFPQIVEDAIQQFKAEKSLLDNPQFFAARQTVGNDGPLIYVSDAEVVRSLYPFALLLTSGLDDPFGKYDHPVPTAELLPSLQRMLKYVGTDAMSVKLVPEGAARTQTVANPLLSPLTLADSVPLWVVAAMPSLGTSRTQTDRLSSADNLREINRALDEYANGNQGQLAPDLQTVLKSNAKLGDHLHSPFGNPKNASDYVYLPPPAAVKTIPPDVVQAYDASELLSGDGANVLYGDGRVVWLDHDAVDDALKQSTTWRENQAKPK